MFPSSLRAGLILVVVAVAACEGATAPAPGPEVVVVWDFEDEAWHGRAGRTDEEAHGGRWCGRVDGLRSGSSARSPLVPWDGGARVEVSCWLRLDRLQHRDGVLLIHAYTDRPPEHPAIPRVPERIWSRALLGLVPTPGGWSRHEASFDLSAMDGPVSWIRLEVRVPRNPDRDQPAEGIVLFDDVVLSRRGERG